MVALLWPGFDFADFDLAFAASFVVPSPSAARRTSAMSRFAARLDASRIALVSFGFAAIVASSRT